MTPKRYAIYLLLMTMLFLAGCINSKPKSQGTYGNNDTVKVNIVNDSIGLIPDNRQPLRIAVPNDLDSMYLMKTEISQFKWNAVQSKFAATAYDSVFINNEFIGCAVDSTIRLYRNLPDIKGIKPVLLIYLRECHNDSYPAIELQTFDKNDHFIDRLLVSVSIFEEGGLFRSSEIDSTGRIKVKDIIVHYDLENDGEEEVTEKLYYYTIDEHGSFIKI